MHVCKIETIIKNLKKDFIRIISWRRSVVVIITSQLHSTKPELKFCSGSNPAYARISGNGLDWK